MEYDLLIREAETQDASEVIALLDQIGQESNFTSLDENGIAMSGSEMQHFLDKQASRIIKLPYSLFWLMS